jgi:transcriptional regulator with XRE-family HTH domain
MTFGELLKANRKLSKLTQKDISEFLKLDSNQMISNVERGVCYFSKSNLKKLCSKYGWNYKGLAQVIVEEKTRKLHKEWLE